MSLSNLQGFVGWLTFVLRNTCDKSICALVAALCDKQMGHVMGFRLLPASWLTRDFKFESCEMEQMEHHWRLQYEIKF